MPIIQPTRFVLVINLKTAKTLSLTIPLGVARRADEVTNEYFLLHRIGPLLAQSGLSEASAYLSAFEGKRSFGETVAALVRRD